MKKLFTSVQNSLFYFIVVGTIFLTRVFLFVVWKTPFMDAQQRDSWHHSYTGLILVVLAVLLPPKYRWYLVGIGLGLFIDESYFLHKFIGITACAGYWSIQAYASIVVWLLLLYWFLRTRYWQHMQRYLVSKRGKK